MRIALMEISPLTTDRASGQQLAPVGSDNAAEGSPWAELNEELVLTSRKIGFELRTHNHRRIFV